MTSFPSLSFQVKNKGLILNDSFWVSRIKIGPYAPTFEGGMTTRKYAGMTKCSKVTASRDLADLELKGIIQKRSGRGRSTSYEMPDL